MLRCLQVPACQRQAHVAGQAIAYIVHITVVRTLDGHSTVPGGLCGDFQPARGRYRVTCRGRELRKPSLSAMMFLGLLHGHTQETRGPDTVVRDL